MKICTKCDENKELSEFGEDNRNKDCLMSACRTCEKARKLHHSHTKEGLIAKIYSSQRSSSKRRDHKFPSYTQLLDWCVLQPLFHKLFDAWVVSDYDKMAIPSCDRLDDYKPYTLDNLQLMTWQENNDKGHACRKAGINNKQSKSVYQYSREGMLIAEHYSVNQASRDTGVHRGNIGSCCNGKVKNAGGFAWCFM